MLRSTKMAWLDMDPTAACRLPIVETVVAASGKIPCACGISRNMSTLHEVIVDASPTVTPVRSFALSGLKTTLQSSFVPESRMCGKTVH